MQFILLAPFLESMVVQVLLHNRPELIARQAAVVPLMWEPLFLRDKPALLQHLRISPQTLKSRARGRAGD
jgi:hypothetical protein